MQNPYESKLRFTRQCIWSGKRKYSRKEVEKIIEMASAPSVKNVVVDGFCGLGGVTQGFDQIDGWMTIACLNHWDTAIQTHKKNHPHCLHLLEDFTTADITIVLYMLHEIRRRNSGVRVHVWLSLECTNFSNAKGGQSREADSRTLADHADRYVIEINPDILWIENVKEFQLWGPMIEKVVAYKGVKKSSVVVPKGMNADDYYQLLISNGHKLCCPLVKNKKNNTIGPWMIPCPYRKGQDYDRWREYICTLGYDVEARLFNCADYGVPQHRVRLIMQYTRKGIKPLWPAKTHDKHGRNGLPKWLPVRDCLDLADEGESVLSFKTEKGKLVPRIEADATIDRLINGALKHVLPKRSEFPWIVKPNSAKNNTDVSSGASIAETSPAVTCFNGLNLAKAHLVDHYFGNGYTKPIDEPCGVSGTKDGVALHTLQFLGTYHSAGNGTSIDNPSPAQMTKDKHPLVTAHFVDQQYSSGQKSKSIDEPCGALLNNPKQRVVDVTGFVMDTQFNNIGHSLDDVAKTVVANRKHYYLVNFQWFNKSFNTVDKACNTIIARGDKSPNYLVTLETGELAIEVFDYDPPHYVRLKQFMAANGIVSINMRMLKDVELLRIMTIPDTTKLSSSSTKNKKMIGNAVPSHFVTMLGMAWNIAA